MLRNSFRKNSMVLVGFLAKKRCGKDTVSDHLVKNYNFKKMSKGRM